MIIPYVTAFKIIFTLVLVYPLFAVCAMFHISLSKPLGATYDQKVEGSTLISSFG